MPVNRKPGNFETAKPLPAHRPDGGGAGRVGLMSLCTLLALVACARAPAPAAAPAVAAPSAPESYATTRQIMLGITIPASDVVFGVAAEAPQDDAGWERVQANAYAVAESGNLLMTGMRPVNQDDWMAHARAMIAAAVNAARAAAARDADAVSDAGNALYETCDGCHARYMPARQGEAQPK